MFTGLIESLGTLRRITRRGNYQVLTIEAPQMAGELKVGESVACDGACLTVISSSSKEFVVEASQETAARTILNRYQTGDRINLERAVRLGERLGGHMVSGHVDSVGRLERVRAVGESVELVVSFNQEFENLVIEKGSIAVNGISLTVNSVAHGRLSVNIIPHTAGATSVGKMREGQAVKLEFDIFGKYILNAAGTSGKHSLTREKLTESGW